MAIIILWRTGVLDPAAEDVVARVAAEKVATGTPGTGTPALLGHLRGPKGSTLYPAPDKGATLNYPFLV